MLERKKRAILIGKQEEQNNISKLSGSIGKGFGPKSIFIVLRPCYLKYSTPWKRKLVNIRHRPWKKD
jgi:hypothetical protein